MGAVQKNKGGKEGIERAVEKAAGDECVFNAWPRVGLADEADAAAAKPDAHNSQVQGASPSNPLCSDSLALETANVSNILFLR